MLVGDADPRHIQVREGNPCLCEHSPPIWVPTPPSSEHFGPVGVEDGIGRKHCEHGRQVGRDHRCTLCHAPDREALSVHGHELRVDVSRHDGTRRPLGGPLRPSDGVRQGTNARAHRVDGKRDRDQPVEQTR